MAFAFSPKKIHDLRGSHDSPAAMPVMNDPAFTIALHILARKKKKKEKKSCSRLRLEKKHVRHGQVCPRSFLLIAVRQPAGPLSATVSP
jgi:hypothetical protein